MSPTDAILDSCSMVPARKAGECSWCHRPLSGKQRQWCSKQCEREFIYNHVWNVARTRAIRIANKRCNVCGVSENTRYDTKWGRSTLEVNHIQPVLGDRKSFSCHHHQANLQVVCFECHQKITKQQLADRRLTIIQ